MNMRPLLPARPLPPIAIATAGDVGIGLHDLAEAPPAARCIAAKEMSCEASEVAGDHAGVLLREEALGDDDEQIDRQRERGEEDQRALSVLQRSARSRPRFVAVQHRVEGALAPLIEAAVLGLRHARAGSASTSSASASATPPCDTKIVIVTRDREFAEQAADDAAHQQQRDEHRHQRDADGHDGEADLARRP